MGYERWWPSRQAEIYQNAPDLFTGTGTNGVATVPGTKRSIFAGRQIRTVHDHIDIYTGQQITKVYPLADDVGPVQPAFDRVFEG